MGFIRALDKQVYFRDTLGNTRKIYDFNLTIGDSIQYVFNAFSQTHLFWAKVIAIDSILINQTYHKVFYFEENTEIFSGVWSDLNDYWIEGIGSIRSPINPIDVWPTGQTSIDTSSISCTYVDGKRYWQHPGHSDCYKLSLVPSGLEHQKEQKASIYPNPFSNKLIIERASPQKTNLTIRNVLGQIVFQAAIFSIHESIDLSHLQNGIYFVQMEDETVFKIVKE